MSFDILKQLTLAITVFTVFCFIVSFIRNKALWKYSYESLRNNIFSKVYINFCIKLFLISLSIAILAGVAYSSLNTSIRISYVQSNDYLGKYDYVYREYANDKNIDSITSLQTSQVQNSDKKIGIYGNISVYDSKENKYYSNTSIFGFDDLGLDENQYISFGKNNLNGQISLDGTVVDKKTNADNSRLSGLENFRGWEINTNKSDNVIFVNIKTAQNILKLSNDNIVFSDSKYDLTDATLTKNLTDEDKLNYFNTVGELSKYQYQQSVFNLINPFSLILIIMLLIFILTIFPLYKTLKKYANDKINQFDYLISTGARKGITTKYLLYEIFLPLLLSVFLSSIISIVLNRFLLKSSNLDFLFSGFPVVGANFDWDALLWTFTNTFSLLFLIIFLLSYGIYAQRTFRYAKISILKLALGLATTAFGVAILFFLKDIPDEAKGLIPYIIVSSPLITLLGSLIFLKLNKKLRVIVLLSLCLIFIIGSIVLISLNYTTKEPSGLFILGIIGIVIISLVINEYSYKDFPKLIFSSVIYFISLFLIILSSTGIELPQKNYDFDLSVQTYTMNNKMINTDDFFPPDTIKSKLSTGKAEILSINDDNKGASLTSIDLISVPKTALKANNLSDDEKEHFFNSSTDIILSSEFKGSDQVKENDSITMKDLSSGEVFTKNVYKILDDNGGNNDISNKIIFPNLSNTLASVHSTLNTIYLIKSTDQNERNQIKDILNKNNIYEIVDLNNNEDSKKEFSKSIIQNVAILIIFIDVVTLLFSISRNKLKSFIGFISIFFFTLIISIYYQSLYSPFILNESTRNALIIIFISAIIIYGANFTVRKFKNNK